MVGFSDLQRQLSNQKTSMGGLLVSRLQSKMSFFGAPLINNGSRVDILPDYNPGVAKARAAFTDARKALRRWKVVQYSLLFPARLQISYKDEDKEILDPQKAMEYIWMTVIPSTEPEDLHVITVRTEIDGEKFYLRISSLFNTLVLILSVNISTSALNISGRVYFL